MDLQPAAVLDSFRESSSHTDHFLKTHGCPGYLSGVSQKQTRLCLVLISAAFKQLGCDLEVLMLAMSCSPCRSWLRTSDFATTYIQDAEETRIFDRDDTVITRTAYSSLTTSAPK